MPPRPSDDHSSLRGSLWFTMRLYPFSLFRHFPISPFRHFAISPFRHFAIPFRHFAISPFRHFAISPFRHFAISPLAISSFHRFAVSPLCQSLATVDYPSTLTRNPVIAALLLIVLRMPDHGWWRCWWEASQGGSAALARQGATGRFFCTPRVH